MLNVLVFELAGQRVALFASVLREVTRAVAIAALPQAPALVEGIINLRGSVIPVLDIRQRFRLPSVPLAPDQHFLIAQSNGRLVALRVDRALDLVAVDETAIASAATVAPGVDHVAGIVRLNDGLLVIHDLERFLSGEEARQLDAAVAAEEKR
jgi:purine-binding chemotaxis protein CheW